MGEQRRALLFGAMTELWGSLFGSFLAPCLGANWFFRDLRGVPDPISPMHFLSSLWLASFFSSLPCTPPNLQGW